MLSLLAIQGKYSMTLAINTNFLFLLHPFYLPASQGGCKNQMNNINMWKSFSRDKTLTRHLKSSCLILILLNIPKSCLEAHLFLPLPARPWPWPGRGVAFPPFMNGHYGADLGFGSVLPSLSLKGKPTWAFKKVARQTQKILTLPPPAKFGVSFVIVLLKWHRRVSRLPTTVQWPGLKMGQYYWGKHLEGKVQRCRKKSLSTPHAHLVDCLVWPK